MNKKIILGSILALSLLLTIVVSIEYQRSILQIFIGFVLFLAPIIFLDFYKSFIGSFIFVFLSGMIIYFAYKFGFTDLYIGLILSILIGGSINIFFIYPKIRNTQTFDTGKYLNKLENHER